MQPSAERTETMSPRRSPLRSPMPMIHEEPFQPVPICLTFCSDPVEVKR